LKLTISGKTKFKCCKAKFGGAIYHRSSSLDEAFVALFDSNEAEDHQFNNTSGFPDTVELKLE
jgi:hypothetical protein